MKFCRGPGLIRRGAGGGAGRGAGGGFRGFEFLQGIDFLQGLHRGVVNRLVGLIIELDGGLDGVDELVLPQEGREAFVVKRAGRAESLRNLVGDREGLEFGDAGFLLDGVGDADENLTGERSARVICVSPLGASRSRGRGCGAGNVRGLPARWW